MLNIKELQSRIGERQEKLRVVKVKLKDHFVGLDSIIDRLIRDIEAWYIMPEIVTRPTIINLWGMTGVGKTDLVRRLSRHLGFTDRFLEMQLTNKGSGDDSWVSTVESIIDRSSLDAGKPGLLLLDEIQRFRSIDEHGAEIHDYKFQDVWSLLSDGQFSSDSTRKRKINELIFDLMWDQEMARIQAEQEDEEDDENDKPDTPGPLIDTVSEEDKLLETLNRVIKSKKPKKKKKVDKTNRRFQQSWWKAQRIKKLAKREEPIEEIMGWSDEKNLNILQGCLEDTDIFEGEDYSQLLIIISGNLDEAFGMATHASDADVDADVFHEHSKRINFVDIKKALRKRFKPEQIARFGNTHLVYPSLSSSSYREIIKRKTQQVADKLYEQTCITINVNESLREAIYRNGVFPVQGTRPLFSTITSMVENSLPALVLAAIRDGGQLIDLAYDAQSHDIVGTIGDSEERIHHVGELDKIRENSDESALCYAAVHEAGHAVAYAVALNVAPTQLSINTVDVDKAGFIGSHVFHGAKQDCLNEILISMAGRAAEIMVFGDDHISKGSQADIARATRIAVKMVRENGMSSRVVTIVRPHAEGAAAHYSNHQYEDTDKVVEEIVGQQLKKVSDLLKKWEDLFHATVRKLRKDKTLLPEAYVALCREFNLDVLKIPAEKRLVADYQSKYRGLLGPLLYSDKRDK